jgi:hypothetical protein
VVIDRLDEGWVDDRIRVKLIKALIEAMRTFHKVRSVKIIVSMRSDLLYTVLSETPSAGFQEEKYRSLYLNLRWTRQQLVQMLDDRVAFLFRRKYTKNGVHLADILPDNQMEKGRPIDYMLERTFFRPREAILFLNQCLSMSEGSARITAQTIRQAEVTYSQQRLLSLCDERRREYPNLDIATGVFRGSPNRVALSEVPSEKKDGCAEQMCSGGRVWDKLRASAERVYEDSAYTVDEFFNEVIAVLYQVGFLGLKVSTYSERIWSSEPLNPSPEALLRPESEIFIHKTFWSALGVLRREKGESSSADRD